MIFPEAQQNDTQNTLTHEKKLGKNFLQNFWQIYRRNLRSYLILITHTQMMTEKQWRIQESKIVEFKQ